MRYYFHCGDGSVLRDVDGEEHPHDRAAAETAVEVLSELLSTRRQSLWDDRRFSVAVKDHTGRLVALLTTTAMLDTDVGGDQPPAM